MLALALAACQGGLTTSVAPSATTQTPEPSATPTPSITQTPDATATSTPAPELEADDIAEVITNDLVVRSRPEISGRSAIDEIRLNQGEGVLLFVLDGPIAADGYDWYLVAPFLEAVDDVVRGPLPGIGWVAAGTQGEDWIAPRTDACADRRTSLEAMLFTPPLLSLACFGDRELVFEGLFGECTYVTPGTVSPSWLAPTTFCSLHSERPTDIAGPFRFQVVPGALDIPPSRGQRIRVTGQFDHPAAQDCEHHPLEGEEARPHEQVVLDCRSNFVATRIDEL